MKCTSQRVFSAAILIATLSVLILTQAVSLRPASWAPLPEQAMAGVLGADMNFASLDPTDCSQYAAMYDSFNYGGFWVAGSNCTSLNLGKDCGACVNNLSGQFGNGGVRVAAPQGMFNDDLGPCGNLLHGTCGFQGGQYGCYNTAVSTNAQGQILSCGDLIGAKNQGTPP